MEDNRNLLRITNANIRNKLLKQGKLNIVAALTSLPETNHVKESFTIDIPVCSEALMTFVVNGLFTDKRKMVFSFCRNFTIIPHGTGWVIINDLWTIGNSTYEQRLRHPSCRGIDANMEPADQAMRPAPSAGTRDLSNDILIQRVATQTNMNLSFSRQLLEEAKYDINEAISMFNRLHAVGSIPPEAFT